MMYHRPTVRDEIRRAGRLRLLRDTLALALMLLLVVAVVFGFVDAVVETQQIRGVQR